MVQIKIYGTASFIRHYRSAISDAIHSCVVEALVYPQDKRVHRFFPLETDDFIYPLGRSEKYIIIEISMFEGRTIETKKKLIRLLFSCLSEQVAIAPIDIEITITETPKHNWGIRGTTGDELNLNYQVQV
ncbi:MAG: tautomerase family protein [Nostoc sp. DedQUE08]|uniref:tautomerase family protein n=1 Tax=unclassified Nostoc TaxID=2593658 RepID=UPI002AD46828|nr:MULTISPECIES: tautomerase family protein [unclassified Nostoc]MDZ8034312.1 tautomerase family protein [Nostoc sp. DedSLP04]MDZ8069287.1 tautomerase family protein [Nostoc sp. DedQUE08]MDZ8092557.1 tautomerase family protein [Nostoc sp. DedQUE05]MDZ8139203.1 tautomerase family protein [Nostoc sp. DedQUE04]